MSCYDKHYCAPQFLAPFVIVIRGLLPNNYIIPRHKSTHTCTTKELHIFGLVMKETLAVVVVV